MLGRFADEAATGWTEPDQGIWEVRGGPRHFLYSKLLCWVALDRAVTMADEGVLAGDRTRWAHARDEIRAAILERGYNRELGAFTQSLGSGELDASALVIPLVGFLPASDARMRSTVSAIRERLTLDGLVRRYAADDGLPGGEGAFLLCSLWLAENLALQGRVDETRDAFERVAAHANDVGLLSEEVQPSTGELLGNYPQAFTHLGVIRAALTIAGVEVPGPRRRKA